ncbi:hypothetical protein PMIT1327_01047 [Prochlorococcus marinus str. MIT 1327]|nr:hypothetical protein PMIT1327_01047 [Prochlorococcus marinus str. MIT 1327]
MYSPRLLESGSVNTAHYNFLEFFTALYLENYRFIALIFKVFTIL